VFQHRAEVRRYTPGPAAKSIDFITKTIFPAIETTVSVTNLPEKAAKACSHAMPIVDTVVLVKPHAGQDEDNSIHRQAS